MDQKVTAMKFEALRITKGRKSKIHGAEDQIITINISVGLMLSLVELKIHNQH